MSGGDVCSAALPAGPAFCVRGISAPTAPPTHPPPQAFFLENMVVPKARELGVAEEYE